MILHSLYYAAQVIYYAVGATFRPQCCNWLTTILNGCALVSVHQCLWACQHDVYNFFGALNMFVVVLMSCQLWFVLVLQTGSLCYGPLPVRWLSFVPSGRSQVPSLVLAVKKVLVHFHVQCT